MEVRISYETIYEMLRNEKQKDELQRLPPNLFPDSVEYLEEKKKLLDSDMGEVEIEKIRVQINNIKRMLKELLDRREKKIIILAMNLSRTENVVYDKDSLLRPEKEHLDELKKVLKDYRETIIKRAANGILPKGHKPEPKPEGVHLKFKHAVPKFAGLGGVTYGPYEPEDETRLPENIAGILIRKGRAERLN